MKNFTLLILMSCLLCSAFSQKLSMEATYEFKSLKKDSYLGNVSYNPDDKTTKLSYVEKDHFRTLFTDYIFDENLQFVKEEQENFNLADVFSGKAGIDSEGNYGPEVEKMWEKYPWFDYKGDEYEQEMIYVAPSWGGKIVATKIIYKYTWNWAFGDYWRKIVSREKVTIAGADNERMWMYDRVNNLETGEIFIIVGLKQPKGTKGVKYQHTVKFQILKITKDFQVVEMEKFDFPYASAISYMDVITDDRDPSFEGENDILDISKGQLAIVFSPVKSLLAKKMTNPEPGDHTMVLMNKDGTIANKVAMKAPTSAWVIQDYVLSADNKDVYFFGPAKDGSYVNQVKGTISPLTRNGDVKEIKYKDFQIMKLTGNSMVWVQTTNLDEFKEKAVIPPSQKKSPEYKGKMYERALATVTPDGELIISGQKFTMKNIQDPKYPDDPTKKIRVKDQYKDLVMFHFDNKGSLKAQYGIKRDKNNKYSKAVLTPQEVALSADGSSMYWTYGELKGMRKGLELGGALQMAGVGTLSKKKMLYYPTVARIDLAAGTIGDFVPFGADNDGKQIYYTNPEFPSVVSDGGASVTYVGEDKKGKVLWLGKMNLD